MAGMHTADTIAQSARLGWMPFYPQFNVDPLDLADQAIASVAVGEAPDAASYVANALAAGTIKASIEDVDAPENWPRTLTLWRSNLFGSSAKGNEYFLKYLLGTHSNVVAEEGAAEARPRDLRWRDEIPKGKLDLLLSADFRMTSTTLLSDIVLPAATWYEKYDLSSTDMHPFVHAFTPAIDPPWEAKSDFDMFHLIARELSRQARTHLGTRKDLVAVPMQHDTPGETAQPHGVVRDWKRGDVLGMPGKTMPSFQVVERDYTAIADKLAAIGPLADKLGFTVKNNHLSARASDGPVGGLGWGDAWRCGQWTTRDRHRRQDGQQAPVPVITSPEWSGSETGGRRYAPFTVNVERLKPWHTMTGRMHFFLDHDWMRDLGEALPTYRPPLDKHRLFGEPTLGPDGAKQVTVRYLTPHSKWSIHSEYQDNLFMLSLSRGGPTIWLSPEDAAAIGVADNDWMECVNANGVLVGRAIVSHRMPEGVVYVHHAQERIIDVPKSEATGRRGGIHNSVTRLLVKPSHLIGGYAQLSYTFNYLGPTGNQRDIVSTIRRRSQEVQY
jgi:nitrate reductase alpha subunit